MKEGGGDSCAGEMEIAHTIVRGENGVHIGKETIYKVARLLTCRRTA